MVECLVPGKVKRLIINILIGILVFIFSIMGGELDYPGNDDTFRNLISVGAFGTEYNYYLPYSNVLFGIPIYLLNTILPSINWYYWIMIIISILAIASVCMMFYEKASLSLNILGCVVINILLSYDYYVAVQFTKAASLWFTIGSVIILLSVLENDKLWILGFFIMLSGIMCRLNCALMLFSFVFLACIAILFRMRGDKDFIKLLKRLGTIVSVTLVAFVVLGGAERYFRNNNEGWNDYWRFEGANAQVIDRGMTLDYNHNPVAYDAIMTDENDLRLFSAWQFGDIDFYNVDWLGQVRTIESKFNNRSLRVDSDVLRKPFFMIYDTFIGANWQIKGMFVAIVLMMAAIMLCGTIVDKAFVLCNIIGMYGMYWYFSCINRFMWRVECGIYVGVMLLMLLYIKIIKPFDSIAEKKHLKTVFLISAMAMLGIFSMFSMYNWRYVKNKNIVVHEADITGRLQRFREKPDNFYVLTDFYVTNNPMSITRTKYKGAYQNSSYVGNWTFPSPTLLYYASQRGYTNPMRALVNDNVYLHATNFDLAEALKEHLAKVLDRKLDLEEVDTELWQIR